MNLLEIRNRIREVALSVSLSYSEIEGLKDTNELLNQTMPCLMWRYDNESGDFDTDTQIICDFYFLNNWHESQLNETAEYQRDYVITEQSKLREFFKSFAKNISIECGSKYFELKSWTAIPIEERISIEGFITINFRCTFRKSNDFCIEISECE